MHTTYVLTLALPPPRLLRLASPNGRGHWAARAQARQALAQRVALAARAAGLPRPLPPPVGLAAHWQFPVARRRDPDNLAALLKPVVDGLVRGGWLVDDHVGALWLAPATVHVVPGQPATLALHLTPGAPPPAPGPPAPPRAPQRGRRLL